ncbi:sugar ABC transporter substrate-binding protein [Streptomyces sp. NPDC050738]|uniref:ABC transporter substrate-binding protein n=1 Tax=Streptomyces sp. NPDC050738 TaxID=3154744 RepID=UPI00343BBE7E
MPGRQSRRSVLAAVAALPMTGVLNACSSGAERASSSTSRSRTTTITFWSALRGSKEVVDEFNKTHDSIQVVYQQIPSGDQGGYAKLSNAARAGNAPDVATIEYPQVPTFAIDGVARDITSLVSDGLRAKLLPQALGLTTFDRRIFSVPLDVEPMVMHYRTDLFEELGLRIPRTWDEFEETAKTVRKKGAGRKLALFPTDGASSMAAFAWQAGGQWFDTSGGAWNVSMADEPSRRAAAYWQRLYDQDLVFMNPLNTKQGDAQITNGKFLVRLTGSWEAGAQMRAQPGQTGKWKIAPLPQWDTAHPALGTQGGSTFAITKDCQHPEAAMEFIEWQVASPNALRARLTSGASSQYPAVPELVTPGRKAFDRTYYSGQDIYTLFDEEAHKIRDGWVWGPRMSATNSVLQDGFARVSGGQGTLTESLRAAQRGTMPDLRALGLSVTEHSK